MIRFYEDGQNPILYVYQTDPSVIEQRWDDQRGWGDTDAISNMMNMGEGFYDEISQADAKARYGGAWDAEGPLGSGTAVAGNEDDAEDEE